MEYILNGNGNSITLSDIEFFRKELMYSTNTLCFLSVHSGRFSGEVALDLDMKCLAEFSRNLKSMYETLIGQAVIKETYESSYIKINSIGRGHFNVSGKLYLPYPRHLLEFGFDIDQTMLKDFADTLYNDFSKY